MSDEENDGNSSQQNGQGERKSKGPGERPVGAVGVIALTAYLALLSVLLFYCLIKLWPYQVPREGASNQGAVTSPSGVASSPSTVTPAPPPPGSQSPVAGSAPVPPPSASQSPVAGNTPPPSSSGAAPATTGGVSLTSPTTTPNSQVQATELPQPVDILGYTFLVYNEGRLLLIVLFAGALGSMVHALRSISWYIGNRELFLSWVVTYILLPFTGAAIALIFYLVIRGGFFSPQASFQQTSPFGFAALSALVGLFSQQAVLKLKEVAETMLAKPTPGENSKPQGTVKPGQESLVPAITGIIQPSVQVGSSDSITVNGSNFVDKSVVRVNGSDRVTKLTSSAQVTAQLLPQDTAKAGSIEVTVFTPPPGGGASNSIKLEVKEKPA